MNSFGVISREYLCLFFRIAPDTSAKSVSRFAALFVAIIILAGCDNTDPSKNQIRNALTPLINSQIETVNKIDAYGSGQTKLISVDKIECRNGIDSVESICKVKIVIDGRMGVKESVFDAKFKFLNGEWTFDGQ